MKRLVLLLFFLVVGSAYAECCCCCNPDNSGPDDPTGEETDGDGSNCIRVSVEQCETFKANVATSVANSRALVNEATDEVAGFLQSLPDTINPTIEVIYDSVSAIESSLNADPSVSAYLQTAINDLSSVCSKLETEKNSWAMLGDSGGLFVSNTLTGVTKKFKTSSRNPVTWLPEQMQTLDNAITAINQAAALSETQSSALLQVASNLRSVVSSLGSVVDTSYTVFNDVSYKLSSLSSEIDSVESYANSISCTACSSGSGGSGSGGSGSGTIDLTPLVDAIEHLEDSVSEQIAEIYELISNFYTDYNSARTVKFSGRITQSVYSSTDNWFSRIESLLYEMSGLGESSDDEEEQDNSEAQSLFDDSDNNIQTMSHAIQTQFSGGFSGFFDRVKTIFSKFNFLGSGSSEVPYITQDVAIGEFTVPGIVVPQEHSSLVSTMVSVVRYAFQAFYWISAFFVVWLFVLWSYRQGKEVILFVIKIYSGIFGS